MSLTISVALCTFNGGRFLAEQLESIAGQIRPPQEVVICDDASSDVCPQIIESFAARARFSVRVVRNERALGATQNFAQAISLCQGELIFLADQDDVWYPHKLQTIEKVFLHGRDTVAVFSDADLIDADSHRLQSRLWTSFAFDCSEQKQFANGGALNILVRHPVVTGATMAFRKLCVSLLTPIPADFIHDRWISFLLAAYGRFEPVPEPLMQYRCHKGQQIGAGALRPLRVKERFALARSKASGFYLEEIHRFSELARTLRDRGSQFNDSARALQEINSKIAHLERRARLPRRSLPRIPIILREVLNRRYWRYSQGLASAAGDLVI